MTLRRTIAILMTGLALVAYGEQGEFDRQSFNAVWQIGEPVFELKTPDLEEPPLRPEARALYDRNRQSRLAGDLSYDSTTQCLPHGVPRLLFEEMPFEFMVQQEPDYVGILYQWNRLVRIIEMDREHYEPLGPTFLGQSVGRWEGNTLVIDTNGFNDSTLLDAAGMPHSDQLHVIERYSLSADGDQLQVELVIDDPIVFLSPWTTRALFDKQEGKRIQEDVCVERLGLEQYR